jgi:hypothetical protein
MNSGQLEGLGRHALTVVAGYLVAKGQLNPEDAATISGAVTGLVGVLMSYLSKRKAV